MKKRFIVEVEIDEAELNDLNSKRARLGQQQVDADNWVEIQVCDALNSKMTSATCRPVQPIVFRAPLIASEGVDATL